MAVRKATVAAEVGLHARPAALFVKLAQGTSLDITVTKPGGDPVNAKSILGVLGMDARQDETVVLKAEGDGAEEILERLAEIVETP